MATSQSTIQPDQTVASGSDNLGRLSQIFGDNPEAMDEAGSTLAPAADIQQEQAQEDQSATQDDGGQDTGEEQSLLPREDETDFSDDVYQRHAKHFKATYGEDVNLEDPVHRILLREIIQRGQALNRAKSSAEESATAAVSDEATQVNDRPQTAVQESPEQVQQFISSIGQYVEKRIRPEVAKTFADSFLKSVWPKEFAAGKVQSTPEFSRDFTKTMMQFLVLGMNDTLPDILNTYLPGLIGNQYPMLDDMHTSRIEESAVEKLETMKDDLGQPLYPDLEELVNSGAIAKVVRDNPEIRKMRFEDRKTGRVLGPVEQAVERQKWAIRLARADMAKATNANVTGLVKKAVETGKRQGATAATRAANGRLAAGESNGTFANAGTDKDSVLGAILGGGESKLSQAVKIAERNRGR